MEKTLKYCSKLFSQGFERYPNMKYVSIQMSCDCKEGCDSNNDKYECEGLYNNYARIRDLNQGYDESNVLYSMENGINTYSAHSDCTANSFWLLQPTNCSWDSREAVVFLEKTAKIICECISHKIKSNPFSTYFNDLLNRDLLAPSYLACWLFCLRHIRAGSHNVELLSWLHTTGTGQIYLKSKQNTNVETFTIDDVFLDSSTACILDLPNLIFNDSKTKE